MSTPTITAAQVKELRDRTGAGMMDCKNALAETGGDIDQAVELLRVRLGDKALKMAAARPPRAPSSPTSTATARSACSSRSTATPTSSPQRRLHRLRREVALHVAASPTVRYVTEDEIPAADREAELRVFEQQAADKPENVRAKIAEGKLRKWMEEVVLLHQEHVNADKHEGKTIEELRAELSANDRRERRHPPLRPLRGRG